MTLEGRDWSPYNHLSEEVLDIFWGGRGRRGAGCVTKAAKSSNGLPVLKWPYDAQYSHPFSIWKKRAQITEIFNS